MRVFTGVCLAVVLAMSGARTAMAQESRSEPLVKQLVAALAAAKLDSIAAADPANPGVYVAALYIPGLQLIGVAAKYPAPEAIAVKLANKAYRDMYLDLSSGGLEGKVVIEDSAADGAKVRRRNASDSVDIIEIESKRVVLDYDFRRQKLSLNEYLKLYNAADDRYSSIIQALLAEIKKGS
jgi:hypothetical protein